MRRPMDYDGSNDVTIYTRSITLVIYISQLDIEVSARVRRAIDLGSAESQCADHFSWSCRSLHYFK